ncbi:hypothetical protein TrST_g11697 [Triparma strigata]|uniref:Uncharacterized protein n=1 Tax=Triparma strigata TaxID=1606541 RepID=A0A9W7ATS8_9STRA|nr:hypothetical protein TrST_g11697 [Triparma strigata]
MDTKPSSPPSKSPASKPQSPLPLNPLLTSLKALNWPASLSLLHTTPNLASSPDPSGYYPLHHAVFLRSPIPLITLLLTLHPQSLLTPDPLDSSLPLHLCVESPFPKKPSPPDTAYTLSVLKLLTSSNPQTLTSIDVDDETPLHRAFYKRLPSQIISFMIDACPLAMTMVNNKGEDPGGVGLRRDCGVEVMEGFWGRGGGGGDIEEAVRWASRKKEDKIQAIAAVVKLAESRATKKSNAFQAQQTKLLQTKESQLEKSLECLSFIKNEHPEILDAMAIGRDVKNKPEIMKGVERVYPLLKRLNDSFKPPENEHE